MKVLCFGKDGLLSTELQKWLPELSAETLVFLGKQDCDITDPSAVNAAFDANQPTVVINAAAYTKVDQCEDEVALATAVNGEALQHIVVACNKHKAVLLHFSTDYVFDGTKDGPYDEMDLTCPINAYGESKFFCK